MADEAITFVKNTLDYCNLRQDFDIITESKGLVEQPKDAELEYRVIAINKSGDGPASNTVMAVL